MAKQHLCFNYPRMDVCFCHPQAFVCALMSIFMKNVCSYVLYGHRMEAAHFRNVCGSLVLQEFCMWCGCRRKAAPFCLCVWCGHRLGRATVHMGTNDRIWFSEPICKKMKETQLVKTHIGIRAEALPDLTQRNHCSVRWSVDGHQFLLCVSTTVMSHRSNLNASTASQYVT